MVLELYNGQKKFMTLVQYYNLDPVLQSLGEPKKGYVAIPGGANHNEQTVRKWAKEFGFRVKTIYEPGIDHEEAISFS